ncbi:hypothetical protein SAY87_019464 [Trapa incisa]|uniref:Uncharacterized protein n=1 Tax=Trapa incisa TaxID=236973 RepID=A0AAN7Q2L5_9MYRT|nr:hypothetical protein SAY87_019464 [Trapa incisa]
MSCISDKKGVAEPSSPTNQPIPKFAVLSQADEWDMSKGQVARAAEVTDSDCGSMDANQATTWIHKPLSSAENCPCAGAASPIAAAPKHLQNDTNTACNYASASHDYSSDICNPEMNNPEDILPNSPFALPPESMRDHCSDFSKLAGEICEGSP